MAVNPVYSPAPSSNQQAPGTASTTSQPTNRETSGANKAPSGTAGATGSSNAGQYTGNVSDHRGKYYTGSGAVGIGKATPGCIESKVYESNGAVAYDNVDGGCWGVTGLRIIIGDRFESIMAGFEKVNWNFHVSGTQPAVPNQWSLPGPVGVG